MKRVLRFVEKLRSLSEILLRHFAVPRVKGSLYSTVLHLGRNEEWYLRVVYTIQWREYERETGGTRSRARACACERAESVERIMCRYRAAASGALLTRACLHKSDLDVVVAVVVVVVLYTSPRGGHRWASHMHARFTHRVPFI